MRFLHCADIHLDSPLIGLSAQDGAPVDRLRGATRRALEEMITLAESEAVDFVLIAGDLYDGDWRDFTTGLFFIQQMARLNRAGIPVFLVHGNHDAESQITRRLPMPGNVRVFKARKPDTELLPDLRVAVHGQSFGQRDVTENLAAGYPPPHRGWFNIGLLHTAADGRDGHARYAPCELPALIAHGYDYWALGHVHRREVLHHHPHIVFPGNLQGRHIRETGAKGCTLVTVADGKVVDLEHRATDVLRWALVEVAADGCADPAAVLQRLRPALDAALAEADGRPLAVRLVLRGRCAAHARLIDRRDTLLAEIRAAALDLGGDALWIEKLVLDTAPDSADDALRQRPDALGGLLRTLAEVAADSGFQAELAADLANLLAKLPPELRDPGRPADPSATAAADLTGDALAALITAAGETVIARLLDRETAA